MNLYQLFEKRLQKIDKLNDFIVLYGKKEESITSLREISSEIDEIKDLLTSCKELLAKFQTENSEKCKQLIAKAQEQQLIMLEVLDKVLDSQAAIPERPKTLPTPVKLAEKYQPANVLTEISNTPTPRKFGAFKAGEQSLMSIADYTKSPYTTKRMRPLALQFIDFEKTITVDEFAKIPGYMRGRETLDDIQQYLESVIIRCFTSKYTLLPKRREAVAPMELDLWNLYKSQEEYFKGLKFITQGDICRLTDKQIDKKAAARITMLRHLKIIREERKNSATCYIWCKN